ncbi:MAG: hypothetical protein Q7V63_00515 [Gammaproteobacteria bacterium]|nr:hypothetical protein [Gammaproteobacteria bacterium]
MKKLIALTILAISSSVYADLSITQIMQIKPMSFQAGNSYVNGSCGLASLTSLRADAWRCLAGSNHKLYDPCFTVVGATNMLACGIDPSTHSNGVFVKIKSFPKAKLRILQTWLLQLPDGTYCKPLQIGVTAGSIVLRDQNNKPLGQDSIVYTCNDIKTVNGQTIQSGLFANSIVPGAVWTAQRAYYNASSLLFINVETTQIAKVWT